MLQSQILQGFAAINLRKRPRSPSYAIRKMLTNLQRKLAVAEEKGRLLLRENLDMKEYMTQKNVPFEQFEVVDRVLAGDFDVPDPTGV